MSRLLKKFDPNSFELRVLSRSHGTTIAVVSDQERLCVVNLTSKEAILDVGDVVGHPVIGDKGEVLYISAETGRLCKIDEFLQPIPETIDIGTAALDRLFASTEGEYYLSLYKENGPQLVVVDFNQGSSRPFFDLPDDEVVASSVFDFKGASTYLTANTEGLIVRCFRTNRVLLRLHDASGFLPKRELRVFRKLDAAGRFLTQVVDRRGIVRLAFENRTTDPSAWISNDQETFFAFSCLNSPLYRLKDFRLIGECGHHAHFCSNADGNVVASLSRGKSNLYDLQSAAQIDCFELDSDFSYLQFCPEGDFVVFDTRGPISDRVDWYIHRVTSPSTEL